MHPLNPDLSTLTDQELQQKCSDLVSRMNQAYSMGNAQMIGQLQIIYEDYNAEAQRRQAKAYEELLERGSKFKKIIDIK